MIDKTPKITVDKDKKAESDKIAKEHIEKIRKILSGELQISGLLDKEKDKPLPEPQGEEPNKRTNPTSGGTWHDRYYGNNDDNK